MVYGVYGMVCFFVKFETRTLQLQTGIGMKKFFKFLITIQFFNIILFSTSYAGQTVKVGIYQNFPLCFTDEQGEAQGIYIDVLAHIAKNEGWKIEYTAKNWNECLELLKLRKIDLMCGIAYTEKRARHYFFNKENVMVDWGQVYLPKGSGIQSIIDLHGKKVATMEKGILLPSFRKLMEQFDITCRFIRVKDPHDVFKKIEQGSADAGTALRLYGLKFERQYNVKPSPIIFAPLQLRFAAGHADNFNLLSVIDNYLTELKKNENSALYLSVDRWLLSKPWHWHLPAWLLWSITATVGLTVFLSIISFMLKRRVTLKTVELTDRNKELKNEILVRANAEKALQESERQLNIRNHIAEIFLTIPNEQMYGEVLQVILKALESPYGTFAYLDENGDRVVPSMTRDIWDKCKMRDKAIFFPREKWSNTLWARCIIEKKSFFSNGHFKVPDGHIQIKSALATPVIHKGQPVGNLMVGNKTGGYSTKDAELLEIIANHIAPILHSRLLNEIHEKNRNQAEEQIKASLREKEVLLKEIHHRTKNNMQVISSILALQSDMLEHDQVKKIFKDTENRIKSMALVHQKLYQSNDLSNINLKEYIDELAELLLKSYNAEKISFILETLETDNSFVLIDIAIPCGLILNELITNSLKYAFPGDSQDKIDETGEIRIKLNRTDNHEIFIRFSDNGIGFPENFDFENADTLGLRMIISIVEHQLGGTIDFETNNGMTCQIKFNDNFYSERV